MVLLPPCSVLKDSYQGKNDGWEKEALSNQASSLPSGPLPNLKQIQEVSCLFQVGELASTLSLFAEIAAPPGLWTHFYGGHAEQLFGLVKGGQSSVHTKPPVLPSVLCWQILIVPISERCFLCVSAHSPAAYECNDGASSHCLWCYWVALPFPSESLVGDGPAYSCQC